jgi:hypothetical protein
MICLQAHCQCKQAIYKCLGSLISPSRKKAAAVVKKHLVLYDIPTQEPPQHGKISQGWDCFVEGQIPILLIDTVSPFVHDLLPRKSLTKWGIDFIKSLLGATTKQCCIGMLICITKLMPYNPPSTPSTQQLHPYSDPADHPRRPPSLPPPLVAKRFHHPWK